MHLNTHLVYIEFMSWDSGMHFVREKPVEVWIQSILEATWLHMDLVSAHIGIHMEFACACVPGGVVLQSLRARSRAEAFSVCWRHASLRDGKTKNSSTSCWKDLAVQFAEIRDGMYRYVLKNVFVSFYRNKTSWWGYILTHFYLYISLE